MTHVPLAAITRLGVHVVVAELTNGAVTVTGVLLRVRVAPVLLVRVMVDDLLSTPTAVVANVIRLGVRATLLDPVPLKPASCGLDGSLSLTTTVPRFAPVDFGPKVTLMAQ